MRTTLVAVNVTVEPAGTRISFDANPQICEVRTTSYRPGLICFTPGASKGAVSATRDDVTRPTGDRGGFWRATNVGRLGRAPQPAERQPRTIVGEDDRATAESTPPAADLEAPRGLPRLRAAGT
jgi:hypothetical protein